MTDANQALLDADHEALLQRRFLQQPFLVGMGARLARLGKGHAEVIAEVTPALTDAGGIVHSSAVTAIAESAALMSVLASLGKGAGCRVVEYKIDYTGAMAGTRIGAVADMLRPGGSLSVTRVEVFAEPAAGKHKLAVLLATYLHDARG